MLFGIPQSEDANLYVLGIKWDLSSSYRRGSRDAPEAIREATSSLLYNSFSEELKNLKDLWKYRDLGDIEAFSYPEIMKEVEKIVDISDEGLFLFLGGDHSITYATLRAIAKHHKNFGLIYFDAHPDMYKSYDGDIYSHACPVRRIVENGIVKGENIVQIGIRAATKEQMEFAEENGIEIITSSEIFKEKEIEIPFEWAYLSFDMDVLDPAYAPGVGNPEPGGLTTRELVEIIKNLNVGVISFDIVELNPHYDYKGITAFAAAKIIREVLALRKNS
ncbi:MAG: agmatinase [Thermoplasmata archaeon]|nr:agmatinase [Thermoplasmata archaeon]